MLDFLLNGFYKVISKFVGMALSMFMEAFKVDLVGFKHSFPGLDTLFGIVQGISFGLLLLIVFYACLKNFYTPASNTTENPLWVLLKAVPAAFLILNAEMVVNAVFSIGSAGYDMISAATLETSWGTESVSAIDRFVMAAGSSIDVAGVGALLGIVLLLFFAFHLLKFLLECVERYVTVCVACYISPLSYCAIASKGTISFFANFSSLLIGQMLLMWINALSLKMIAAGLEGLATNTSLAGTSFFFKYIVLIAFTIVAQKMDNLLQQVGFHNIRGGGGNSMLMGAGIVAMAAGKAIKGAQGLVNMANKTNGGKGGAGVGKPTSDTTKQTGGIGNRGGTAQGQPQNSGSSLPKAAIPVGTIVPNLTPASQGPHSTPPGASVSNGPKTVNRKPTDSAPGTNGTGGKGTSIPNAPVDTTGAKGASNPIEGKSGSAPSPQVPVDTTGVNAAMENHETPTADASSPLDITASAGSVSAPTDSGATSVTIGSSPVSNESSETVNMSSTAVSTDTTGGDSITVHSKPEAVPSGTPSGTSAPTISAAPSRSAAPANTPSSTASPTVNPRTPVATTPASTSHAKAFVNETVQNHQATVQTQRATTMERQAPSAQRHVAEIQQGRAGGSATKPPHRGTKK